MSIDQPSASGSDRVPGLVALQIDLPEYAVRCHVFEMKGTQRRRRTQKSMYKMAEETTASSKYESICLFVLL